MKLTVLKTFSNNVELSEVGILLVQLGADHPELDSLCEGFFAITHTLSEDSPITGNLIKLELGDLVRYEVHALLGSLEVVLAPVTTTSSIFAKAAQVEKLNAKRWETFESLARESDSMRVLLKRSDGLPTMDSGDIYSIVAYLDLINKEPTDGTTNT